MTKFNFPETKYNFLMILVNETLELELKNSKQLEYLIKIIIKEVGQLNQSFKIFRETIIQERNRNSNDKNNNDDRNKLNFEIEFVSDDIFDELYFRELIKEYIESQTKSNILVMSSASTIYLSSINQEIFMISNTFHRFQDFFFTIQYKQNSFVEQIFRFSYYSILFFMPVDVVFFIDTLDHLLKSIYQAFIHLIIFYLRSDSIGHELCQIIIQCRNFQFFYKFFLNLNLQFWQNQQNFFQVLGFGWFIV